MINDVQENKSIMKYSKEITNFENTNLYKNFYNRFVTFLKMSGHTFKSKMMEDVLLLKGSQIRKLVQHARRRGVLIYSGPKGYRYINSKKDADSTLQYLKNRAVSLQSTIDAIENSDHYKSLTKGK